MLPAAGDAVFAAVIGVFVGVFASVIGVFAGVFTGVFVFDFAFAVFALVNFSIACPSDFVFAIALGPLCVAVVFGVAYKYVALLQMLLMCLLGFYWNLMSFGDTQDRV